MQTTNSFIQWWVGTDLPAHYFAITPERRPKEISKLIRLYYRTWIVHPIKRRIAKYYLSFLQTFFSLKVIGITGSSGKTTTKDMLYSILSQKGETAASFANIDPVFNIPTTIFQCSPSTNYLILEMGIEFHGDMNFYTWLVKPNVGIITNIYQTHTHFFGNEEGVAKEKGVLIKRLGENSVAVLNNENNYTAKMANQTKAKVVMFGKGSPVRASEVKLSLKGTEFNLEIEDKEEKVSLPIIGEHFTANALAASAAAYSLGLSINQIKQGLERFKAPEHRLNVMTLKNGAIALDDTYNNNPSAAKATIETISNIKGKRKLIVVFGDMKELGETEIKRHKEIAPLLEKAGASYIIGVGPLTKHTMNSLKKVKGEWVEKADDVLKILKPQITKNTLVLLKASRSIGLDSVAEKLQKS